MRIPGVHETMRLQWHAGRQGEREYRLVWKVKHVSFGQAMMKLIAQRAISGRSCTHNSTSGEWRSLRTLLMQQGFWFAVLTSS
eukprot:356232-Chlamydomonas_euryale.AAC.30